MHAAGRPGVGGPGSFVRASGLALLADGSVDVCLSSNVAEHVAQPWRLGAEMLRVTKPGGLAILSYTVWLGPFGGHETGLWHYLGGARAAARYTRRHGHPPKNNYGSSPFAVAWLPTVCAGRRRPGRWWRPFRVTTRDGPGR